jgi:hypothetical protein
MSKRSMAAVFFCLATILFLSRYVFALWYRGEGHAWGPDDFANFLGYVGTTPWILAAASAIAGVVYLIQAEGDR